jgi:alcohol dehydrogenase (NADP+)
VDCAEQYKNQQYIGEALSSAFQTGKVKREDVWITSKLWINHYDPDDVRPALEQTLKDLKLDYLDLYLIHWPIKVRKGASGEWPLKPEDLEPFDPQPTWKVRKILELSDLRFQWLLRMFVSKAFLTSCSGRFSLR